MLHYSLNVLRDEDIDLGEALHQLNRALTSEWPGDLEKAVRELLPKVEFYRSTARCLIEDIEKAQAGEELESKSRISTNKKPKDITNTTH
jgi:hypothetical protein